MTKNREFAIAPKVPRGQLVKFLTEIEKEGIKIVNVDPSVLKGLKTKLTTIYTSQNADYVIVDKATKIRGRKVGMKFKVLSNADIEKILHVAKTGLDFVIVEVKDWKIIPLENIIAKLHKIHTKIFAIANSPEEVRKMFSILEIGVDGVIFSTSSLNEVKETLVYLGTKNFDLKPAKILEIKEVGNGERVCVDTDFHAWSWRGNADRKQGKFFVFGS